MFKGTLISGLLLISTLLSSCSTGDKANLPPITPSSGAIQTLNKDSVIKMNTGSPSFTGGKISSTSIHTIESIKNITNLEELKKVIPSVDQSPQKNHPKFLEFQKAQITLGLLTSQIQDKEYLKLQQEQRDISQGKDIWSNEIKNIEKDFQKALGAMHSGQALGETDFKSLLEKKSKAIRIFQSSEEYKKYIAENQDKLTKLNDSIKTYYTPDILELQKNIEKLNTEIYGNIPKTQ